MSMKCELHTEGGALENHNAEDEQEEKLAMIKSEELRGRRKTRKRGSPKSQEQRVSENGRRPSCGEGREQGDSSESSFSGAGAGLGAGSCSHQRRWLTWVSVSEVWHLVCLGYNLGPRDHIC